jgi:predicted RNase H-related nuclease YkuK (DUF458 family)
MKEEIRIAEIVEGLEFKKYDGTPIKDVHEYVKYWVEENPYGTVTIGCDSQEHSRYIKYAVTIVMYYIDEFGLGHGGHVISTSFQDHTKTMESDIYTKLWAETIVTVETAKLVGEIGFKPIIHLDYNSDETKYSNVLYAAGLGYCKGLGFEAYGKPHAYAASHTADRIAKSGKKR